MRECTEFGRLLGDVASMAEALAPRSKEAERLERDAREALHRFAAPDTFDARAEIVSDLLPALGRLVRRASREAGRSAPTST